ncbi:MAG: hypothetical protein E7434_01940 [Ruminococcaceae bacterium]|nr:hypothetical protein [Oscillospiraceae bacterium]
MIMVEIYVPLLQKTYDFSLDETVEVRMLLEEIAEIICQKERWPRLESANKLLLCNRDTRQIYPPDSTLSGTGTASGSRLIMV